MQLALKPIPFFLLTITHLSILRSIYVTASVPSFSALPWLQHILQVPLATWFGQNQRTFSCLTVSTINKGQCIIESSHESPLR